MAPVSNSTALLKGSTGQFLLAIGSEVVAEGIEFVAKDLILLVAAASTGFQIAMHATCYAYSRKRHRNGERLPSGFVESVVNQVVNKWMVKHQQMGGASGEHISCCSYGRAYSTEKGKLSGDGIPLTAQMEKWWLRALHFPLGFSCSTSPSFPA
jgi:hypothetical protein